MRSEGRVDRRNPGILFLFRGIDRRRWGMGKGWELKHLILSEMRRCFPEGERVMWGIGSVGKRGWVLLLL